MPTKVTVPKLGLTMKTGTVVEWIRKEGEKIERGEPLFSLDTEKVIVEIESPASGVLRKIFIREGTTVPVGGLLAIIAEENELVKDLDELAKQAQMPPASVVEEQSRMPEQVRPVSGEAPDRVPISPSARKLARDYNVDLSKLTGTGPGGRIQREDVLRVVETTQANASFSGQLNIERVIPLGSARRTMIDRLRDSYSNALHVTLQLDVDFSQLKAYREKFPKPEGEEPSYTDLLVKATALALRKIKLLNSIIEGDQIKVIKEINIGIAVSLENGLVVPVVRNADEKALEDIVSEAKNLTERARSGKLTLEDVTGGTFTVTNLGMYGVDSFSPIINPPEAGILAVGRIIDKPVVIDGQLCVRPMGTLTLAFDHRIIDGAGASQFLKEISMLLADHNNLI